MPTEVESSDDWDLPEPQGVPASEWHGIPVISEAINGEEIEGLYVYTVGIAPLDVQGFYEQEMDQLGWVLFATGEGEEVDYNPFLMFQRGNEFASVMLVVHPTSGLIYVLLHHQSESS